MLILLPEQRDGLKSLEESLTPQTLLDIQHRLRKLEVDVSLPKFKLEFEKELSSEIQAIGARKVFSSRADFSEMTSSGSMPVSEVIHKAVIEVNEEGSEAAAVTGIIMVKSSLFKLEFRADHPFLFAIVD
ncbi:Serpin B10 like protein [Argiope bruennichi]|uniref:Serpin B10 like protein n=1 Tax=Argiope bruennichi TaxID=94029 RepID=A0A8T0EHY3_ARGBR|nr:Serpin B10 like protein [Argiope bruennichi]